MLKSTKSLSLAVTIILALACPAVAWGHTCNAGDPGAHPDCDGDGYNSSAHGAADCDDTNASVHPGVKDNCDGIDNDCDGTIDNGWTDADSDGYADCVDCDDADASANPGATEVCDLIDNDCNGSTDEGVTTTYFGDADSDGFGTPTYPVEACTVPAGYVADNTDCDDTSAAINPSATEVCDDANIDEDCDGLADDADTRVSGKTTWYADSDTDGYGDLAVTNRACDAPAGYVADATDCDDTVATTNPGATEVCDLVDNDCDGDIDEGVTPNWYADTDSDGYGDPAVASPACEAPEGYVADSSDCDDILATTNPGATEVCDLVDNDCDGDIDEGVTPNWYADTDSDGYGDPAVASPACEAPEGYVGDNTDCVDTDAAIYPGATEVCNGLDDDCDGTTDESDAIDAITWYLDYDSDTYGDPLVSQVACAAPIGYVGDNTDCNDTDATIYPGAPEVCDDLDNNCDGSIDEGVMLTWYEDADSDGYGDGSKPAWEACTGKGVHNGDDCDDSDAAINPDASESDCLDPVDYDCDGFSGADDVDGDGILACQDCDDWNASVYPTAEEICDGLDNDCDIAIDEDGVCDDTGETGDSGDTGECDPITWCLDSDGDGYGDPLVSTPACEAPLGYVADCSDCDDNNNTINPSSEECENDGIDRDCDGQQDWCLDTDTGETSDTALPKVGGGGCGAGGPGGCAVAPRPMGFFGGLLGLLMLLRRRRS